MDGSVAWRAALIQGVSLAVAAVALAAALPHSFFESYGWIAGPAAWAACALVVAAVLRLPVVAVLVGAALAGLPMLASVLVGVHWLGAPFGIVILALWCGRLALGGRRRPRRPASAPAS